MVGVSQWDRLRIRARIPGTLPGYQLVPYVPPNLLYIVGGAGSGPQVLYVIDYENGALVSEATPLLPLTNGQAGTIDSIFLPSCCPTDGTVAVAIIDGGQSDSSLGLTNRHGDTAILFAGSYAPTGAITDVANGPLEYVCYAASTNQFSPNASQLFFCRKSDTNVNMVLTWIGPQFQNGILFGSPVRAGLDCDRENNFYCYQDPPTNATPNLARYSTAGTLKWQQTIANMPNYVPRSGYDKQIVVGPPLKSGTLWFQSLYVGNVAGWLSQHDCRTGVQTLGGATTTAAGWPYNLNPLQMSAASDGLVTINRGSPYDTATQVIEKLSYSTLGLIWRHVSPSLSVGRVCTTSAGDVLYTTGITDTNGAYRLRKLRSNDGALMWDHPLWLPIGGSAIVSDAGRIGGFSWPNETWARSGSPPIDFT